MSRRGVRVPRYFPFDKLRAYWLPLFLCLAGLAPAADITFNTPAALTTIDAADVIPLWDTSASVAKKITFANFKVSLGLFNGAFSSLTGTPTTLAGYGITDAQGLDSDLTAIAALSTTSFGRSLLTQADAAAARTTLGVGTGSGDALTTNPLSQFAATTSAQLAGVLNDENGFTTGAKAVFAIGTLAIPSGKTLTASNTITLTATDGSTLAIGGGGTLGTAAYTAATAYEVPLTFSTGLTRSTNTITINQAANFTWTGTHDFSGATVSLGTLTASTLTATTLTLGSTEVTATGTEMNYLSGVTSAIQTQLGALQPLDSDLTSWASVTRASGFDTFAATPTGANLASLLTTALPVSKGGTGATALTDLITLGTHTTGNYVATAAGTANEITVSGSGSETAGITLSLPSALTFTGKTITGGTFASPTLTTPTLGVATATSINKVSITAPASGSTLTIADGKTLTVNQTTTLDRQSSTGLPVEFCVAMSDETTDITTGTAKATIRAPYAFTVTAVRASVNTASSSGLPTVDVNEAGTTILSTKLTIDASEKTSTTAATAAVISDTAIADDAELTFDVDTAGTGAKGLKVWIYGYR